MILKKVLDQNCLVDQNCLAQKIIQRFHDFDVIIYENIFSYKVNDIGKNKKINFMT